MLNADSTLQIDSALLLSCKEFEINTAQVKVLFYTNRYKKDGYRQQNVRQRQKLISIIDYDVCMTFY